MKRTVLVTGGTVRLGKCIADYLRKAGWKVFTTSHRPDAKADFCVDFTDEESVSKFVADFKARLKDVPLDGLVNNAGIYGRGTSGKKNKEATLKWRQDIININLVVPTALTVRLMNKGVKSSVVNILDAGIMGKESVKESDMYAATKRIMQQGLGYVAKKLAPFCRVNAVAPGSVLPPEGAKVKAAKRVLANPPAAEDVAKAVAFLLDNDSITGVVIPVDGGDVKRLKREEKMSEL